MAAEGKVEEEGRGARAQKNGSVRGSPLPSASNGPHLARREEDQKSEAVSGARSE